MDKETLFLWEEGPIWDEPSHRWRVTVWVENEKHDAYGETWRVTVDSAAKATGGTDGKAWYQQYRDSIALHPVTRQWVEGMLGGEQNAKVV